MRHRDAPCRTLVFRPLLCSRPPAVKQLVLSLLSPIPFFLFVAALYVFIGKTRKPREYVGFALMVAAAFPAWDGALLLYREGGRHSSGRLTSGVIVGKLSSSGAQGSRTIGGNRFSRPSRKLPAVRTANGFSYTDVIARWILYGSRNAWMVEYRYACARSGGCWRREAVPRELWARLHVGSEVRVRLAKGQRDPGRLEANPQWNLAITKLGIAGSIFWIAAYVAGRAKVGKRRLLSPATVNG